MCGAKWRRFFIVLFKIMNWLHLDIFLNHYFANKAYLSDITETNIFFEKFTYNMAAKTSWHMERNYVTITGTCIHKFA